MEIQIAIYLHFMMKIIKNKIIMKMKIKLIKKILVIKNNRLKVSNIVGIMIKYYTVMNLVFLQELELDMDYILIKIL